MLWFQITLSFHWTNEAKIKLEKKSLSIFLKRKIITKLNNCCIPWINWVSHVENFFSFILTLFENILQSIFILASCIGYHPNTIFIAISKEIMYDVFAIILRNCLFFPWWVKNQVLSNLLGFELRWKCVLVCWLFLGSLPAWVLVHWLGKYKIQFCNQINRAWLKIWQIDLRVNLIIKRFSLKEKLIQILECEKNPAQSRYKRQSLNIMY